ncbi:hypothetical protein ACTMSW_29245 [Micromonospora sp. BQ11]
MRHLTGVAPSATTARNRSLIINESPEVFLEVGRVSMTVDSGKQPQ